MATESTNLASVPFLNRLGAAVWAKFVDEYEGYRAKDGRREVQSLVSAAVLRVISLRLQINVDDLAALSSKEFIQSVSAIFAPSCALESFDRFKRITMNCRAPSLDAVLAYCLAYEQQEVLCSHAMPEDKYLQKQFVQGLRPTRLSERVRFAKPKSLSEAKHFAVMEVENMLRMSREVAMGTEPPPAARSNDNVSKGSKTKQEADVAPAPAVRCYSCQGLGHKRGSRECPNWTPVPPAAPSRASVAQRELGVPAAVDPSKQNARWTRVPEARLRSDAPVGSAKPPATTAKKSPSQVTTVSHDASVLPRVPCTLRAGMSGAAMQDVPVTALLDSGATESVMSPVVYAKLRELGVKTKSVPRTFAVAGGSHVTAQHQVVCGVSVRRADCPSLPRDVELELDFWVMETPEDILLSYSVLRDSGLWDLLTNVDGVSSAARKEETLADVPDENDDADGAQDCTAVQVPDSDSAPDIRGVVVEYQDVFGELAPGGAALAPMPIKLVTPGQLPLPVPPRRLSPAMAEVVSEEVQGWLQAGIVRPSSSPCSAPVVVVRKKDGGYRVCVDYRKLNELTVAMKFPVQNARAVLERLAGKCVFGTLDLRSGFHQVPIEEESRYLTAFATPDGLFEFTRVEFGLKNGPSYFQQAMSRVLNGLIGVICEVFIDDIIVYGCDGPSFVDHLRMVLGRLKEYNLKVKGPKCLLGVPRVVYLGHLVDGNGLSMTDERKAGIMKMQPPRDASQLRSFLGMANYFRAFVKDYATLTKPLCGLSSKKVNFAWTEEHDEVFGEVKDAIQNASVLAHMDYALPIILRTDASTSGVGAVLFQVENGKEKYVSFVSKAFNDTERKWSTLEQEAYGIFYSIINLRHYLLGHSFVVESDHRNLMFLERSTVPKVVRWRLRLLEYDFIIRHVPGKENVVADALSRCLTLRPDHCKDIEEFHNSVIGHHGVRATEKMLHGVGKTWTAMREDIRAYIASCPLCQKTRLGQANLAVAMASTAAGEPFEIIALDTIGPLPEDQYKCRYVIAAIDCFTRFVEMKPCHSTEAAEAAAFVVELVGRYGAPIYIRTDQGSQFTAGVFAGVLELLGIKQLKTLPYHPEANGIVERVNGEIGKHLRALILSRRKPDQWSRLLPLVQRIVNSSYHSAIGTTPARLMFAGRCNLDRGLFDNTRKKEQTRSTVGAYIEKLTADYDELVAASQQHQADVIEQRARMLPQSSDQLEVGDYVLAAYPSRPPSKLAPRWRGPLLVVEQLGDAVYGCQDVSTGKVIPLHLSRLKLYNMDQTEDPREVAGLDQDEWVVESIVDHRPGKKKSEWMFRVRWLGYEPEEDSWLKYKDVRELEALDVYLEAHPGLQL